MKKMNKVLLSALMYALVFVMPVGAFFMSSQMSMTVHAYADESNDTADRTRPTVYAAVYDELLSIQAFDEDSGVEKIFVNGYEFTDLEDGKLTIRLQQFDASYEYFMIQAVDYAGNFSDEYKVTNPYYTNPEEESNGDNSSNPALQLPISGEATEPSNAVGTVTEYSTEPSEEGEDKGKEFYTITTASEKTFYLIIDNNQSSENVYLLTQCSENDLLNFTGTETNTLPLNSAVVETALPNRTYVVEDEEEMTEEGTTEISTESSEGGEEVVVEESDMGMYLIIGVIILGVVGVGYYMKVVKGKDEFEDDEEEEAEIGEDVVKEFIE